jgi:hypothetical protein
MQNQPRLALVSLCTLAFAIGCGGGDSAGPPAVATVDVAAPGSDLIVGQTAQLSATARDAKGNSLSGRTTAWTTSSATIATVSTSGLVTGVAPGTVTISATIDGKIGSATMNVVPVPIASVAVTLAASTVQAGLTTQATAVIRDGAGNTLTGRTVAWSSSAPTVASVSDAGVVTGLTPGAATITATSEGRSGSAQVTITSGNPADAPQITSITPSPMVEGQPATINGSKFGAAAVDNIVRVGGVAASVTAVTPTSIQITVPNLNCKPAQPVAVEISVGGNTSAPRTQPFTPAPTSTFTLAQGKQQLVTDPANFCLQFPASSASESYLIGVQSVLETAVGVTPVKLAAEAAVGATTASASRQPFGTVSAFPPPASRLTSPFDAARSARLAKQHIAEAQILEEEHLALQPRLRSLSLGRRGAPNAAGRMMTPTVPATVKVGDVVNIRVPSRGDRTCQLFAPVAATVKAVGTNSVILEDNANPTGGFSATDYQNLSTQFDTQIFATDVAYFGAPTDFDNNSRIAIVFTKEVNKTQNLLGVVYTVNFFSQTECAASNEGEFFYGRAPDPNGSAGAAYSVEDALADSPVTIAHEFAHVIQLGRRLQFTAPNYVIQSTWELEGQATFAEEVNGFTATGFGPGQNLGIAVVLNDPQTAPQDWFIAAFADLFVFYGFDGSRTNKRVNAPEQCSWLGLASSGNDGPCLADYPVYGASWSFLRWLSDQFGPSFPGGEKGLHQKLIDNAQSGFATIAGVVGTPIDVLLAQWAAALYADDRVSGLDQRLTFTSWNLAAIDAGVVQPARLVPRDRPFGAFSDEVSVRGGSTAYFLVSGNGRSATGIRARDLSDGTLPGTMRMWVVRLR